MYRVLLLVAGLALAAPPNKGSMPTKRPTDHDAGKRLWEQSCWQCHGKTGRGDGPAASALPGGVPSLEGKVDRADFEPMVAVIQAGRGRMPAYSEDIDRHDSKRILIYLADLYDGATPPPPPDEPDEEEGGGGQ